MTKSNKNHISNNQPTGFVQELLNRPMDRKQFMQFAGAALVGVAGFGGLAKALTSNQSRVNSPAVTKANYGGGAYGGRKRST